jgi:hypothetical protein
MQDPTPAGGETLARLANPFLDLAIAGLEFQLKAWQAFQVEGTRFIAHRMRENLKHLRTLGHCCDVPSAAGSQRAWLHQCQRDYVDEWGRLVATSFALGLDEFSSFASLIGQPQPKAPEEREAPRPSNGEDEGKSGFQAAA